MRRHKKDSSQTWRPPKHSGGHNVFLWGAAHSRPVPGVSGSLTGKTLPLLCPRRERPRRLRASPPGALPIFRRRIPAFSGFSSRPTTFTLLVDRGEFSADFYQTGVGAVLACSLALGLGGRDITKDSIKEIFRLMNGKEKGPEFIDLKPELLKESYE